MRLVRFQVCDHDSLEPPGERFAFINPEMVVRVERVGPDRAMIWSITDRYGRGGSWPVTVAASAEVAAELLASEP